MKKVCLLLCAVAALIAAAAPYQRKLPKTYVFSRGQWHYNPVLNYGGRWVDIPLLTDPELTDGSVSWSTPPALKEMEKIVLSYGLDGLASLKGNGTPALIRMLEKNNVPGFVLLPEIYATGVGMYKAGLPLNEMRSRTDYVFLSALKSNLTLKHNGKTIISSYNADDRPADFWRELLADYRRTEGDKFIFLPLIERPGRKAWHVWRSKYNSGSWSKDDAEAIKAHYREYARACDGLYVACAPVISNADRHTDIKFYQLMIDLATEVLAEPEFKDKYFAIAARLGHKNATRVGYIRGSYGTWCYRQTMQTALAANPDIIIIPEWDEANENTSLRPTRCNLSTFTRITRVFQGKNADLPHDDLTVPNLVLSCRKVIALGENVEYELLGLPDSGGACEAVFSLLSPDGKTVFRSEKCLFDGKGMKDYRFVLPTENFAGCEFLRPELNVTRNGKTTVYRDGLQYVKIEPASNCDYQYAKQPLRDIVVPKQTEIKWDKNCVTVKFDAGEPIAYAEILDDNAPVYTATADGKPYWRESKQEYVFTITFQNLGNFKDQLKGTLRVPGVPGAKWMFDSTSGFPTAVGKPVTGESFNVNFNQRIEINRFMLAIPADKINTAVLDINIPGYFEQKLPLKQVVKVRAFGVSGKKVPVMTVTRQNFQLLQAPKLRENSTGFTAKINPQSVRSTLHFQVITESGKAWRSAPVTLGNKSGKTGKITVWSEVKQQPLTLTLPVEQIPVYDYRYDPACGTALRCDAGLRYYGAGGGYAAHMSSRLGARRDSTQFISLGLFPKKAVTSSVGLSDKGWEFKYPGQHIVLPTGVASRRTAFTVTMELNQRDPAGKQTLFDNSANQPGVIALCAENGQLKVEMITDKLRSWKFSTGLFLPQNKDAVVKLHYGLTGISVAVNGKTFTAACTAPGLADTVTGVGGGPKGAFKGTIRRVTVDYRAR